MMSRFVPKLKWALSFHFKHSYMEIVLQGSILGKTGKWKQLSWFCSPPPSSTTARYSFEEYSTISAEQRRYGTLYQYLHPLPPQRPLRPQKLIDPLLRKPLHPAVPPSGQKGPSTIQLQISNLY